MKAILLDIEGTTTPIDFVYKVLFPYAKEKLEESINLPAFSEDILLLQKEFLNDKGKPDCPEQFEALSYLRWMMSNDIKSTALKSIQGKIWEAGYKNRQIKGAVFPDVVTALENWKKENIPVYIYSSGSILAQKLLFEFSEHGDLTPLLSGYFDTTTGPKFDAESYRKISEAIKIGINAISFFSDNPKELDAALMAGMKVYLADRPGNAPVDRPEFSRVLELIRPF